VCAGRTRHWGNHYLVETLKSSIFTALNKRVVYLHPADKSTRSVFGPCRPRVHMSWGSGAEGDCWQDLVACSQASQRGLCVSPGKGFGVLERCVVDMASVGVVWPVESRPRGHTSYRNLERQSSPRGRSTWKNRSCPMWSPFHDDGKGVYHLCFRLGNYPFVTGIRPSRQVDDHMAICIQCYPGVGWHQTGSIILLDDTGSFA
jgi:hypothetical protein